MSANALVTIFCDHCGAWSEGFGVADTAALARKQLRGSKWVLAVKDPGGGRRLRDFCCPEHAEAGARW